VPHFLRSLCRGTLKKVLLGKKRVFGPIRGVSAGARSWGFPPGNRTGNPVFPVLAQGPFFIKIVFLRKTIRWKTNRRRSHYRSIDFAGTKSTLLTPPVVVRKARPKTSGSRRSFGPVFREEFLQNSLKKLPVFRSSMFHGLQKISFFFRSITKIDYNFFPKSYNPFFPGSVLDCVNSYLYIWLVINFYKNFMKNG